MNEWTSFWCFGTPDRCSGTLVGATALCCVGGHVLYGATAPQYCIVPSGPYCTASYSFLLIGLVSQTDI